MARIDDLLIAAVKAAGPKPDDDAPQKLKNPWGNKISNTLAVAIAQELRERGTVSYTHLTLPTICSV